MCLEENYSDSPSNEYSRHYSAESESEYLRRQNMNSTLGEEQKKKKKKGHHVCRSSNFDPNSDKKPKKGQNDNGIILGRVSIDSCRVYTMQVAFNRMRTDPRPPFQFGLNRVNLDLPEAGVVSTNCYELSFRSKWAFFFMRSCGGNCACFRVPCDIRYVQVALGSLFNSNFA